MKSFIKVLLAGSVLIGCAAPAFAFEKSFLDGIVFTSVYGKLCKPGSVRPPLQKFIALAGSQMTTSEEQYVKEQITSITDPDKSQVWQMWCTMMSKNSEVMNTIERLNDIAAQMFIPR